METAALETLIAQGESLEREFKSDSRREFTDKEIYDEVVALANTNGGMLLIGVEDDRTITGSRPRHGKSTDVNKLKAAIFNNTQPSINTRVSLANTVHGDVIIIAVDMYPEICATTSGKVLHRITGSDGKPASVPLYPHEQRSRRTDLGLLDFSAQILENTSFEDLNPLEFERLRQTIQSRHGDHSLLELSDTDIVKALRLVETQGDRLVPTVAGILLLGTDEVIRKFIPTHMLHFQVLDKAGKVRVNDDLTSPLIRLIEETESRFLARLEEDEIMIGMYRMPIPAYHRDAFREAVNNTLLHRDYSRMGAVFIQWYHDHLLITNPGGFPMGITPGNILVHEPRPRNERLAEAFKRIGLIEKTGRGVDKIYLGQLWYGRPAPDYSRSDTTGVRLTLYERPISREFTQFVFEEERKGHPFELDELIVMESLLRDTSITPEQAVSLTQRNTREILALLQALEGRGIIASKVTGDKAEYIFSPEVARRLGILSKGIPSGTNKKDQVVLFIEKNGKVTRKEVAAELGITDLQSRDLLRKMKKDGLIHATGDSKRMTFYVLEKSD
jgi:ATP-dependent DNA helicase RecG